MADRVYEIQKYIIAGFVNTAVGYSVFFVALRWMNLDPEIANAVGYAVALTIAFFLNRSFVFAGANSAPNSPVRFIVSFAIAFALNQAALFVLIRMFSLPAEIAQIFSMALYTVAFYLLNKHFAFRAYPIAGPKNH